MKTPKSQLKDDEKVIRADGGGPASFLGAKGGYMFLTNKRIFHESLIGGKMTFSLDLQDIVKVEKVRWSQLVMILPILKCVKVYKKDGSSARFNVKDKDGWVVAINNAI